MSLLLSVITMAPAMTTSSGPIQGYVSASPISPDATCGPGAICASGTLPVNRNGCYLNNFWNKSVGGTPLTIDVTETGPNGSTVYVYWVNATKKTISIASAAKAKYYCPR
jgi:hypothetical protein